MEFIDEIPIGKIKRASKVAKTGAKVGINYLKCQCCEFSASHEFHSPAKRSSRKD
mgnify:CR=1 FL=1